MPKVSVIIPTCNRAVLVERAIRSVLSQTYTDFEILVSDDASTDNTPQVIGSFTDPRIRYTRYEKNRGVIEVRNDAVKNSTGSYIAFLDDDDEWLPTKLEKQLSLLDDSPDNLGLVYTGVYSIDTLSGRIVKITIHHYKGNVLNDILLQNFVTTSSVIVKKQCFQKVGLFDREFISASDNDMWIRIAEQFEFDYVGEPLINYYHTPISISRDNTRALNGLERLLTKHYKLFALNNRALSNHWFKIGIVHCYSGDLKEGRKALMNAARFNPLDIRIYYNFILSILGYSTFTKFKAFKKSVIQCADNIIIYFNT